MLRCFQYIKCFLGDLLFFYSTQYLFYTITKGLTAGEILKVDAFYPLFIIIMQLPAAICADLLGRKKKFNFRKYNYGILCIVTYYITWFWGIFIANIIYAFGYSLKGIQETNMLYDSTATKRRGGALS